MSTYTDNYTLYQGNWYTTQYNSLYVRGIVYAKVRNDYYLL